MNDRSFQKKKIGKKNSELNLFEDYENALAKAKMELIEGCVDQLEQECNELKDDCSSIRSQNTEFFDKLVDNARERTIED